MDPVFLARLQFALTICFHFIFPPITIGTAWLLVVSEYLGWKKRDPAWVEISRFFAKILAVNFAVGVATGIVMEFQFGTNWSSYSKFVGDIFGAPLAAEAIFAFFLESTFLGLYLFGRKRVSPGIHWFSILMVAVGATLSAFWILVANSWQQTPTGFVVRNGRAELVSFAQAVFNPSMLPRFFHTMVAALISGAFFMGGISAYLVLKDRGTELAARTLKLSVIFGLVVSILALFPTGHVHAQQVARTQPEKFATIEGLYTATDRPPVIFFGIPTLDPPGLKAPIGIPGMLGLMAFGDPDIPVRSLQEFPEDEVPRGAELWLAFVSFHNMVLLGLFFILVTAIGTFLVWKGRILRARGFLRLFMISIPLPVLACQFGWTAAEVGRQPWIVYRLLRTAEAASPTVGAGEILFSIILFGLVYLALGVLWFYLILRKMRKGPDPVPTEGGTA